eukprot:scaffold4793_cov175-Amphora_coffeaeformis.AAC.12
MKKSKPECSDFLVQSPIEVQPITVSPNKVHACVDRSSVTLCSLRKDCTVDLFQGFSFVIVILGETHDGSTSHGIQGKRGSYTANENFGLTTNFGIHQGSKRHRSISKLTSQRRPFHHRHATIPQTVPHDAIQGLQVFAAFPFTGLARGLWIMRHLRVILQEGTIDGEKTTRHSRIGSPRSFDFGQNLCDIATPVHDAVGPIVT